MQRKSPVDELREQWGDSSHEMIKPAGHTATVDAVRFMHERLQMIRPGRFEEPCYVLSLEQASGNNACGEYKVKWELGEWREDEFCNPIDHAEGMPKAFAFYLRDAFWHEPEKSWVCVKTSALSCSEPLRNVFIDYKADMVGQQRLVFEIPRYGSCGCGEAFWKEGHGRA